MGKDGVEEKVAAIEALRANDALRDTPATALDPLRKALKDRNNFVCSKAAKVAGDLLLRDTIPDLLDAFDRFLKDPVKTDSQCWAKYAIIKALKDLAHDDAAVYLRGIAHIQMEAVWGGKADVAGPLRGACALVLVACSMPRDAILLVLADALADKETGVRVDVARAIAQLPGQDSILMLRVKALAGDKEPAVVGQCLLSLLGTDFAWLDSICGAIPDPRQCGFACGSGRCPGRVPRISGGGNADCPLEDREELGYEAGD
jgi:HEAT repeat protein